MLDMRRVAKLSQIEEIHEVSVDSAASFDFKDEIAERIGIYLQLLVEVSAHKHAASV